MSIALLCLEETRTSGHGVGQIGESLKSGDEGNEKHE